METRADICLVVEGSYPYVTGGVSSWIQWLVESLPELSFALVALVADTRPPEARKYRLPDNVTAYHEHVIFDYGEIEEGPPVRIAPRLLAEYYGRMPALMADWRRGDLSAASLDLLRRLIERHPPAALRRFLYDEAAFAVMTQIYETRRGRDGFVKYFYNQRNIHLILFRLMTLVPRLPAAAVYHAPGTGYAGLLCCLRARLFGGRSMLTEHGIYLQEREMELLKSQWLDDAYLKEMWIDSFSAICRWQYRSADRVITLFEGNRQLEIGYGAPADGITVIPNGIDIERFRTARQPRCTGAPRRVALVGRVDAVKDVKTFLQAAAICRRRVPHLEALVIGPTDDPAAYYEECRQLVEMLDLTDTVTFTGRADVVAYYRQIDLLLLTSIKEAMPLVVMEAMASGLPVVATDVGACRELIYGLDDGIGPAGEVARIMDAENIAVAAARILQDPDLANQMARNGIQRIETFYRQDLVLDRYRRIYLELCHGRPAADTHGPAAPRQP